MTVKTEGEETTADDSRQTTRTSQELKEEDFQKYAQGFTGRLEKPYPLEIDPTVSPVINPPRTIPAALSKDSQSRVGVGKRGVIH